ncbi:MAG TPA: FAD-dependent oxidoreductase [Candidatus Limnocylindria bacterium]|jgi:D-amino-acid dehydrogenase|nr:FAD-dependent oxidoreductase [Candidatus Limnocylindria bacterium]
MSGAKHIVIIGGGVIGLCTAYYAARRGHRVTVIERSPEQHDGCSFGNAGMIVPSHFVPLAAPGMVALGLKWMWNPESPFYIKPRFDLDLLDWALKFWQASTSAHVNRAAPVIRDLSFASRGCFEELATLPGMDFGLVQKGLVMLCKTQHALDDEAKYAAQANALGVPAEVLDAAGVAKLDPDVTMDVAGGVYFPKDCHLSPGRFMAGLKRQAEAMGVKFVWNAEVTGFTQQASRITAVKTMAGEFVADEFVLCGGSWSPVIARDLRLKIPLQAGKGYSLTLPQPRELPQVCSILTEARVAVTPMGSTLRFGGTMEIAGLNEDINPIRVQGIIKAASKYYPKFTPGDFAGIRPWRGLRPCSPDGMPYVGRTSRYGNLVLATGHAMMGLSLGPITGRLVAEILSGEPPSSDLTLLDPDRYA